MRKGGGGRQKGKVEDEFKGSEIFWIVSPKGMKIIAGGKATERKRGSAAPGTRHKMFRP